MTLDDIKFVVTRKGLRLYKLNPQTWDKLTPASRLLLSIYGEKGHPWQFILPPPPEKEPS